jgi:hypothetical protein
VAAYRAASLDGFKGEGEPIACSFFVRDPEAGWVVNNLLGGMRAEALRNGVRVHVATSAIVRLARFVVGLGAAAKPETAVLAETVAELARGALAQAAAVTFAGETEPVPDTMRSRAVRARSDV